MAPQAVRAPEAQRRRLATIVAAGTRLFDRNGFTGTTMDDIAEAAGITTRTLYRYVSSKPDFLQMIHEDFLDAAEAKITDGLGDPREDLEIFVRGYASVIVKHQRAVRVFFEEEHNLSAEARTEVVRRRDEFEARLRSLLTRGVASGQFRAVDAAVTSAGIFGALASVYTWFRPSGTLTATQLGTVASTLLLDGMGERGAHPRPREDVETVTPIAVDGLPREVVDAAVRLFATRGYAETSTQEIAAAAGVTKSALFYHIGSKQDLLYAVHRAFGQRTLDDLDRWRTLDASPSVVLASIVVNHAVVMGVHRDWVRVFTDQARYLADDQRREVEELRARYVQGVADVTAAAMASGELREGDPRVVALITVGMLNWMSRWFDPVGRLDAPAVGQEFAELVLHGVVEPQRVS